MIFSGIYVRYFEESGTTGWVVAIFIIRKGRMPMPIGPISSYDIGLAIIP